jgi:hypothetical protein
MFNTNQIMAHLIGDYVLQSDWLANNKTKRSPVAALHVVLYSLPFLCLTTSWKAILVIMLTHFLIDRFRLARHVGWFKNRIAPMKEWEPWSECSGTGYGKEKPPWMAVWLMIIVDQIMHITINALAIKYL